MAERVLILGGTREAAELAAELVAAGNEVTTSLAGRTREPAPLAGKVRTGGFGGAAGLARFLLDGGYDRIIDATHPFAVAISANAAQAANIAAIAFEQRVRPPWKQVPGDDWSGFATLEAARDALPTGSRVLLALGSQHIATFAARNDVHFVVRMVECPQSPLPLRDHELVIGRPEATARAEAELLRSHRITHLLCRNSGGKGAYAKIEAARNLGLPVLMISRPQSS